MVLLDTNVFIIDRFFARDPRYAANRRFLDNLSAIKAGFSLFSLLELCGIASFNLSPHELKRWSYHFDQVYDVQILEPSDLDGNLAADWLAQWVQDVLGLFERKMTWGDAVLLQTAEAHSVDAIVTWNTKHFVSRTTIPVMTPEEYMVARPATPP